MAGRAGPERTKFEEFGLSAYTHRYATEHGRLNDLRALPAHTHLEIEIHLVEIGEITLECAGRDIRLSPGDVVAFWGGLPHRDVDPAAPETIYHVAQVPVVNALAWAQSRQVLEHLLDGEVLLVTGANAGPDADPAAFGRWTRELRSHDQLLRQAAEMEIQARLLRLLSQIMPTSLPSSGRSGGTSVEMVAHAIDYATRHFIEPITVDDIARAVSRHHDHLMTSFRQTCGLTLWQYVTRLRVTEAQRLLAATDLSLAAICHRAGFGSTTRMYEAFHRYSRQTPARYRQSVRR